MYFIKFSDIYIDLKHDKDKGKHNHNVTFC